MALALGAACTLFPPHLLGDQTSQPHVRIGLVRDGTRDDVAGVVSTFRDELAKLGYVEGRNLEIVERWTNGVQARLPDLMHEVLESKVDVIFTNATPAATAAKNATSTVPIVAFGMADPVRAGLVQSLARPGGNLTGVSMGYDEAFAGKWLELLQETIPQLRTVAVIVNPNNRMHRFLKEDVAAAAIKKNLQTHVVQVAGTSQLAQGFKEAHRHAQAAIVFGDASTMVDQQTVTTLAAKHRIAVMYGVRSFVEHGGLMSYGPDVRAMARRSAHLVDHIIKGRLPGDLPVEQPTKFELLVNLSAARALGITMPQSVLVRADEVIR